MILTTEQFFEKYSSSYQFEEGDPEFLIDKLDFKKAMIEFTKIHVEACKKEISKNARTDGDHTYMFRREYVPVKVDKDSILNAYPLTLIK